MDQGAPIRALLIEDNPGDARLIREMIREARGGALVQLKETDRLSTAIERLSNALDVTDAVLLDLSLPDSHGFDTFLRLHAEAPSLPIVVLSGLDDETVAVRAVQEGAQDYLVKGHVDGDSLVRALRYAIERKRLEEAQREVERQKDEFISHVSHDLRTPVAAIKASLAAFLAAQPPGVPLPQHRMLANIGLAADELARLVEDLLDTSRLQAGRVELWCTTSDLRDVARRAARAVESLLHERHQVLEIDLPDEPLLAHVDVERIVRVLVNVLGNSNKYAGEGAQICLRARHVGEVALISVIDDGPGIQAIDVERVFHRFYRAPANHGRMGGTGLGLAIARGLVELHHGRVWAEAHGPREGSRGATFCIELPMAGSDIS